MIYLLKKNNFKIVDFLDAVNKIDIFYIYYSENYIKVRKIFRNEK